MQRSNKELQIAIDEGSLTRAYDAPTASPNAGAPKARDDFGGAADTLHKNYETLLQHEFSRRYIVRVF